MPLNFDKYPFLKPELHFGEIFVTKFVRNRFTLMKFFSRTQVFFLKSFLQFERIHSWEFTLNLRFCFVRIKSSHPEMLLCEKSVLENSAIFTGKNLCWPATVLKRNPNTSVFVWILWSSWEKLLLWKNSGGCFWRIIKSCKTFWKFFLGQKQPPEVFCKKRCS